VRETTFVEAVGATLARAMREDERVIVLGEDVAEGGPYTVTAGLAAEFGSDRVLDTPPLEDAYRPAAQHVYDAAIAALEWDQPEPAPAGGGAGGR